MKTAEEIYEKSLTQYISPNSKYWESDWYYEPFPLGSFDNPIYKKVIKRINELLAEGLEVRCFYTSTSIRGIHNKYISYRN